jgi:hypothetical protein
VLTNLNDAFCCVFDYNYKGATEAFRNVLLELPSNLVASNNIATCHIFNNMLEKAIEAILAEMNKDNIVNAVNE